jgi:hypothetical protein
MTDKIDTRAADLAMDKVSRLSRDLKSAALDALQEIKAVQDKNNDPEFQKIIDKRTEEMNKIFYSLSW